MGCTRQAVRPQSPEVGKRTRDWEMGRQAAWGTLGGWLLREARRARGWGFACAPAWGFGRVWLQLDCWLCFFFFFSQSRKRGGRNENRDEETWTTSGDGAHEASRVQQASAAMVPRASQGERGRAAGQTPEEAELLHGDGGSRYLW